MRREQILNAISKIERDVTNTEIPQIFKQTPPRMEAELISHRAKRRLVGFAEFANRVSKYDETQHKVFSALSLESLIDPLFWQYFSEYDQNRDKLDRSSLDYENFLEVRTAVFALPKKLKLLRQLLPRSLEKSQLVDEEESILETAITVRLVEEDGELSSPLRVAKLMNAMDEIYSALAKMMPEESDPISVAAIDSGSDKSFDFLGAAKIIGTIREIAMQIYHAKRESRRLDGEALTTQIANTLPVLADLRKSVTEGILDATEAKIIEQGLMRGIEAFIDAGALTPEMENYKGASPRLTMRPEPLLLSAPKASSETVAKPKKKKKKKKKKSKQPKNDQ